MRCLFREVDQNIINVGDDELPHHILQDIINEASTPEAEDSPYVILQYWPEVRSGNGNSTHLPYKHKLGGMCFIG